MGVQIQAKLRKDAQEYDGLAAISEELIKEPMKRRTAVIYYEVTGYQVDLSNGGLRTPKVRVVAIEPMDGDAAEHASKLLDEAYSARTGQAAPPPSLFDDGVPPDDDED